MASFRAVPSSSLLFLLVAVALLAGSSHAAPILGSLAPVNATTLASLQGNWTGLCCQYAAVLPTGNIGCLNYRAPAICYVYNATYNGTKFWYSQAAAKPITYANKTYTWPAYTSSISNVTSIVQLRNTNTSNLNATDLETGLPYIYQATVAMLAPALAPNQPKVLTYIEDGVYKLPSNIPRNTWIGDVYKQLQCSNSNYNYYCRSTKV